MTGKERFKKTLAGEKPDKLALHVGNYNNFICHYYGISIQQYLDEPELTGSLIAQFAKEFGLDFIAPGVGYILYGCGPEIGLEWEFPEGNFPGSTKGLIQEKEDVDKIKIPERPTGYFEKFLEIGKTVKRKIGEKVFLSGLILGPFAATCFLRGLENTLLDTVLDLELYSCYMQKSVELSKFIGRHVLELRFDNNMLNEIFLVPGMVNPDFYHRSIAPYDLKVCEDLDPHRISNSMASFMGKPDDKESQREAKWVYEAFFGTQESLEAIRKGSKHRMPGQPIFVTVSGKMLVNWNKDELIQFIEKGLELVLKEVKDAYPSVSVVSVQSSSEKEAKEIADKLLAINEFRDHFNI